MSNETQTALDELRARVSRDPGTPEFVELASRLIENIDTRSEGREVLFFGLSADPENQIARLILAKSFYLDGLSTFCARELAELRTKVATPALERLLKVFSEYLPEASSASLAAPAADSGDDATESEEEVFGEMELDAEFDDAEDELK